MCRVNYLGAPTRHDTVPAAPPPGTSRADLCDGMAQAYREMADVQAEVGTGDMTVDQAARWDGWHRRWQACRAAVVVIDLGDRRYDGDPYPAHYTIG